MLVYEHENVRMWDLSICISRYLTTIEGTYNINAYYVDIYDIITL